jgi:hypothetical protein
MQINFEIEKKDILAGYLYTIFHNKSLRILYLVCLLFPVYFAFSPLFNWLVLDGAYQNFGRDVILQVVFLSVLNFVYAILLNIGIFVVFNGLYLFLLILKHKSNDGTLGQHIIELRENHLLEATDVNETLHSWKSIQKIIEWRNYILIYVSPTNAHIIPRRCFDSIEAEKTFLEEAKRLKESAKHSFSPSYLASNS